MHELLKTLGVQAWSELVTTSLHVLLIVVLAWLGHRLVYRLLAVFRQQLAPHMTDVERAKRVATLARVLGYIATLAISAMAVLLVLHELGIAIAPLLAAAGVVGIAVGFGAQSLVKDYFTGIVLLLEDQARVGDSLEAGGKTGIVEAVTLRHLRLRDEEGHVHFVPNGAVTTVSNRSRDHGYAVIAVSFASDCNMDAVLSLMHDTARRLRATQPWDEYVWGDLDVAGLEQWSDAQFTVRARLRTAPLQQVPVRCAYLQALRQVFKEHQVNVLFAGK